MNNMQMISDDSQTSKDIAIQEGSQPDFFSTSFKCREELINSTKNFYAEQGYALSIKSSRKDKYVVLCCDRGGNYRNKLNITPEERKRKSGSRLINCQFELCGKKKFDEFWTLEKRNTKHNHEPSIDMSGHPSSRQLSKEQILVIERMARAGVQTRQILSALRVSHFAMKELYKQWELVKSGKMKSTCTSHFKSIMGLPYAHMLSDWKDKVVPIDVIHPQWRIDNRQFNFTGHGMNYESANIKRLLGDLEVKYHEWPLAQKDNATAVISGLVNGLPSRLLEPNIVLHKGRPQGSKNKKDSSSTKRNLSEYEIVEKTRKCSICGCTGHNSRSCQSKSNNLEFTDCYTPCLAEEGNADSDYSPIEFSCHLFSQSVLHL